MLYMKLQIKRRVAISTMTIALLFACTVQPVSPGSSSESTSREAVDSAAAVDCEVADPDEYGNVVHWCDDGSYWWIDSVTGYRYEMDASGNGITDDPAGYPTP